jgi:peptidyl-prolyl cis-trans isomerase A (cyclophilin A)
MNARSFSSILRGGGALLGAFALALMVGVQTRPQTQPDQPAGGESSAGDQEKVVYALMKTSKGEIVLELNREKAPISVANFLSYVDKKFYDDTIFHRVIPSFMIQGGGFDENLNQKPTDPPIKNEWTNGLLNKRGTVAMARMGDAKPNPERVNSATCQFFINVVDNPGLDQPQRDGGAYAVFGKVVAGMKAVDTIKIVPTTTKVTPTRNPLQNVPVDTVKIESVRKISEADARKMIEADKGASSGKPQ